MFGVLVATAVLVAIAELGDKTQMLSLLLATRFSARRVLLGVFLAVLALQSVAVTAGRLVGGLIPQAALGVATGLLFIAFGIWAFRDASKPGDDDEEGTVSRRSGAGAVLAIATTFFLAELGDKTQVLTFALAADPEVALRLLAPFGIEAATPGRLSAVVAVWLGSTLGMMLVNGAAILLGSAIGTRVSRPVVGRVSGLAFVLFGIGALAAQLLTD